jgi:hypothetical protein
MYLGEPLGNEVDGRSTVIATEVADTVEAIMPNLMRVFTTNDKYVRFSPRTAEDMESAEQASDYVNYVLNTQNPGYQILHTFFKDALLFRLGVVKFFYETREEVDEEEYSGLSEEELTMLLNDPTVELVSQTETVVESMYDDETGETEDLRSEYDLTVRIKREEGEIKVINIPPEEFLVSRHATSLDDANFIAHRTNMTVSDLVAMGYDREEVEQYAGENELDTDREVSNRFQDLESSMPVDAADPTLRSVPYYECIIKMDYDGDGIAERRRVCAIGAEGKHILHNEPFDHIPFACVSPIMMPHRLIGRSIFDMTDDEGKLIPTHNILLRVQDQCQDWHEFTQVIEHPVISPTEICGGDNQEFPMFNPSIPVQDVLYTGQSLLIGNVSSSQIKVSATPTGDHWTLNNVSANLVTERWVGNLVMIDTCGYETEAQITVRDCVVPNVFTPDGFGPGGNNSFRIRGLDGFQGSQLTVFNRYGVAVFKDATTSNDEFELVWSGDYNNGNPAPAGVYQWVLVRSDGFKDAGQLTLFRQD